MKTRRYYSFLYYRPYRELRERAFSTQIHKTRDGLVHLELSSLLQEAGFTFGGTLLNVPTMVRRDLGNAIAQREPSFASGDLVVLGTRPPLDDDDKQARRVVDRSSLHLETVIFRELRNVLTVCRRNEVAVRKTIGVPTAYETVQFGEFRGAFAKVVGGVEPRTAFTMGYSIWLPRTPERSWNLWAVFGVGGTESAIFAYLLRTQFGDLMRSIFASRAKRLLMVRFAPPTTVPCPLLRFENEELNPAVIADLTL